MIPARMTAVTRAITMIADAAGEDEDDTTTTVEVEGTTTAATVTMIEVTVIGKGATVVVMEVDVTMIEEGVATMTEDIKLVCERPEKPTSQLVAPRVPALWLTYDIITCPPASIFPVFLLLVDLHTYASYYTRMCSFCSNVC